MINNIWCNFSTIAIVLLCLASITLIVWHNISKKIYTTHLLILLIGLFVLSLWSFINTTIPTHLFSISALLIIIDLLVFIPKNRKAKHKQLSQIDQAQLIRITQEQERSRIYANLHDDVGAKLLELIYSAQDDKTKTLAKNILTNMRQAVAQTQNIQCTTEELIKFICDEAKVRFDTCHINLNCTNTLTNNKYRFTGVVPSVIERICREIISNIIKHAQATDIEMVFISQATEFSLTISDNGIGFENNNTGKGLTTIEKRANRIKAIVNWHSGQNKGTQFTLTYPYDH